MNLKETPRPREKRTCERFLKKFPKSPAAFVIAGGMIFSLFLQEFLVVFFIFMTGLKGLSIIFEDELMAFSDRAGKIFKGKRR